MFVDCVLTHLRSKARRLKVEVGLDLLIIDYLQLIEVPEIQKGVRYVPDPFLNLREFVLHWPFLGVALLGRNRFEGTQLFVVLRIAADEDFRNQTQGKLNSEIRGTLIYANLR